MSDITITATSVKKTTTTVTEEGIAGGTITAGMPVYKDQADSNKLKAADSDLSLAASRAVGIALHAATLDQPLEYATGGDVTYGSGLTAGVVYVVSATAGAVAPTADLDTNTTWYATILGVASSTSNLKLSIKAGNAINA
jgi:hypothetical protein